MLFRSKAPASEVEGQAAQGGAPEAAASIRPLIPLGQFRDTFIIAIDDEGLAIIDQHVAHERVLFERVMHRLTDGPLESQRLLVPMLVERGLTTAWLGLAGVGLVGGMLAIWGWHGLPDRRPVSGGAVARRPIRLTLALGLLMLGHGCFAMGIVPHTLYWVDFIVRKLEIGRAHV